MNAITQESPAAGVVGAQPWTCPFCPLLCDGFGLTRDGSLTLVGSDCPRALAGLAAHRPAAEPAVPSVDGRPASLEAAVNAAAKRLADSRLPLIGGLATDLAGFRAIYRLANLSGALLDHAHGDALMHSLRALQDRGSFYTTIAEIRNRADLIVCLGTDPGAHYPEFFRRCAAVEGVELVRQVVFVAPDADLHRRGLDQAAVERIDPAGDIFDSSAMLAALIAGKQPAVPDPALANLARQMRDAHYCVIVWESGRLPKHGALVAEAVLRMVNDLNRTTRAASFCLGGGDGAYTANYAMTWMSGLPLRTGVFKRGLEHDPLRYVSARLLAEHAVDVLLWVAGLGPELAPPPSDCPRVVLGHPALSQTAQGAGTIFVPVATPGIGSAGHLFRTDGGVVLPLEAVRDEGLPTVAQVVSRIADRLAAREAAR